MASCVWVTQLESSNGDNLPAAVFWGFFRTVLLPPLPLTS